ncbi:MAG TPA: Uma2 family endonuclease, partial [Tepidisphaeraceae bacterium]|nr:Uma2 family endonuclease [Tepidisphaeraceae bacterium]
MRGVISNSPAVQERLGTAEDFAAVPDTKGRELDDGRIVEKPMGTRSGWVGSQLLAQIAFYLRDKPIGWVFGCETMYRCYPGHPNQVRKPDVSFIAKGRLPNEEVPDPFIVIPPDLAVEVLSAMDLASEINRKVMDYLDAGVRLIWIIDPETRTLLIRRADGSIAQVNASGA